MSDPMDRLRGLRDVQGGRPLPAAEVRRLGDRMRRRRNALTALGTAAVVAVIATGAVVVGQQGDSPPVAPSPSPPPSTERSPDPSPSPLPVEPSWTTDIPESFPLGVGLPDPGGDVPDWEESRRVDTPWRGLPCPTDQRSFTTVLEVDAQRVDAWAITVQPPAESHSRHLALYPDAVTAERAVEEIRSIAEACGPREALPDLTEFRYAVDEVRYGDHRGLLLGGAEYLVETGELTGVSRSLNTLVWVGNAVLLTSLSDESSAVPLDLDETEAAGLASATAELGDEMCVFAADPCE